LLVAFLFSTVLIGGVCEETSEKAQFIYNMDQEVAGKGFFCSYKNLTAGKLGLSTLDHGSGSYNHQSKYLVQNDAKYDSEPYDDSTLGEQTIYSNQSTDFAYEESKFDFGKSFKAGSFQSKGQEEICIKNYADSAKNFTGATSMNARFNSLDILSSSISAKLYYKDLVSDDDYESKLSREGKTNLILASAFTGKGHIGVLNRGEDGTPIKIDEDYVGTFSLTKKMSHEFKHEWKAEADEWLPCCQGSFVDMNLLDQRPFKSAKGVFDCSCNNPLTEAEFPRVY
jgi:hypothetical protein